MRKYLFRSIREEILRQMINNIRRVLIEKKSLLNPKLLKIYFILTFCLITLSSLLVWNIPATEYEISIYASTPQLFWIIIYPIMLASFGLFILLLLKNNLDVSLYSKLCLISSWTGSGTGRLSLRMRSGLHGRILRRELRQYIRVFWSMREIP